MLKNAPTFSTIRTPSSYQASEKRYLRGSRADVRVPYREIALSATRHGDRSEESPPLPVYDTSGPYTDPDVRIDLPRGLPNLRRDWIKRRDDTEILSGPSCFERLPAVFNRHALQSFDTVVMSPPVLLHERAKRSCPIFLRSKKCLCCSRLR